MNSFLLLYLVTVYLIASIPFSLVLAKILSGIDVRQFADGNPGAANAWHYGSKIAGTLGCILDISKGSVPVFLAKKYWPNSDSVLFLTGVIAVSGHAWPIYLNFNGGKSLAITAGVFLSLFDSLLVIYWIVLLAVLSSLSIPFAEGVIITLVVATIHTFILYTSWYLRFTVLIIALIVAYKHRITLRNLSFSDASLINKIKKQYISRSKNRTKV